MEHCEILFVLYYQVKWLSSTMLTIVLRLGENSLGMVILVLSLPGYQFDELQALSCWMRVIRYNVGLDYILCMQILCTLLHAALGMHNN